jgi:hypothetical protein
VEDGVAEEVTVTLFAYLEFLREGEDEAVYEMMLDRTREASGPESAVAWSLATLKWDKRYLDQLLRRFRSPASARDAIVASFPTTAYGNPAVVVWTRGPKRKPVPFLVDPTAHRVDLSPDIELPPALITRLAELTSEKAPN